MYISGVFSEDEYFLRVVLSLYTQRIMSHHNATDREGDGDKPLVSTSSPAWIQIICTSGVGEGGG